MNAFRFSLAALAVGASLCPRIGAAAEELAVYRCVQEDGRVAYSDNPTWHGQKCKLVDALKGGRIMLPAAAARRKPEPRPGLSIERARQLVAHDLRDPEATHYREVFKSGSGAVCGQMNAKNGLGGYVGYVDFVVTPDETVITREDYTRQAFTDAYLQHCRRGK